MNTQNISLNTLDLSLQVRAETNSEVAAEYAEDMREGAKFPPITVFSDGTNKYLADGFHRVAAAKVLGLTELPANIIGGDRGAALTYALKANATHGLRRTNADKRRGLEKAWEERDCLFKGEKVTCRSLAAICYVSEFLSHDFMKKTTVLDSNKTDHNDSKIERSVKKQLKAGNDRFGVKIPEQILPVFQSGDLRKIFKIIRSTRADIAKHFDAKDIAFCALGQQVLINLDNACTNIKFAAPHCVCRACRGEGCYRCRERGFMTLAQYNALPSEFKAKGDNA